MFTQMIDIASALALLLGLIMAGLCLAYALLDVFGLTRVWAVLYARAKHAIATRKVVEEERMTSSAYDMAMRGADLRGWGGWKAPALDVDVYTLLGGKVAVCCLSASPELEEVKY